MNRINNLQNLYRRKVFVVLRHLQVLDVVVQDDGCGVEEEDSQCLRQSPAAAKDQHSEVESLVLVCCLAARWSAGWAWWS